MAPKASPKAQARSEALRSESTTMDDSQSQSQDTTRLQELMHLRSERDKIRRRERKTEILASHKERMGQLRTKAENVLKGHDERVRAIRRPKVERLLQLLRRKQEIEAKLSARGSELEGAYLNASMQFQHVINERIEELA